MSPATYYNTTHLSGDALRQAITSARHQEQAVLAIFRGAHGPLAPSQVHQCGQDAGRRWPIWSVRRAITNLTDAAALEKLPQQRMGPWGKPEFLWRLAARAQYPERQGTGVTVVAA